MHSSHVPKLLNVGNIVIYVFVLLINLNLYGKKALGMRDWG